MLRSSPVGSLLSMKKKAVVLFLGAALAGIIAFMGAGGCDATQNAWNCSDLCNRYQDCFDAAYDVSACSSRCQNLANNNQIADERANACQLHEPEFVQYGDDVQLSGLRRHRPLTA
jgi:hypothetical protein